MTDHGIELAGALIGFGLLTILYFASVRPAEEGAAH